MSSKSENNFQCSFQEILLSIVYQELNMMLYETMQLNFSDVNDEKDITKLTSKILNKIAQGNIQSVHLNQEKAKKYIALIEELNRKDNINQFLFSDKISSYNSDFKNIYLNPFAKSPFI